jgi:outer membrane protein OmpA-like peptidoglycan-associated protein
MKGHSQVFFAFLVTLLSFNISFSQTTSTYYVVIGAFARVNNAVRFTAEANNKGYNAQYAINSQRKLYYVYVLSSDERRPAFSFMIKLRTETEHKEAWVFIGKLGIAEEEEPAVVEQPVEPEPEEKEPEPVVEQPEPVVEEVKPAIDSSSLMKPVEEKPEGKPFLFRLTSGESGIEVIGEVHIQEAANASQYQAIVANEVVYLKAPRNTAGTYLAIVQAPGYKREQILVDFNDPSTVSTGTGPNNEAIIPFALTRSKRGDYIEFNNVRFFRNSSIFEPQSQNELDGLVDLLKEETKYKIRVHAHCNGKNSRDITTLGDSKNYFATTTLNGRETASAKRLTELRAELVKRYLVEQGIESNRIKTKAEGGRVMIYPQNSTLANYNDRIEIEVMKGK